MQLEACGVSRHPLGNVSALVAVSIFTVAVLIGGSVKAQQADSGTDQRSSMTSRTKAKAASSVLFSAVNLTKPDNIQTFSLEKSGPEFGKFQIDNYSGLYDHEFSTDNPNQSVILGGGFSYSKMNQKLNYKDGSFFGTETRNYEFYSGEIRLILKERVTENLTISPGFIIGGTYVDGKYQDDYRYTGSRGPYAVIADQYWLAKGTALLAAEYRIPLTEDKEYGLKLGGRGSYSHFKSSQRSGRVEQTAFRNDAAVANFRKNDFADYQFKVYGVRYGASVDGPLGVSIGDMSLTWEVFASDTRQYGDVEHFRNYQEFGGAIGTKKIGNPFLTQYGIEQAKFGVSYIRGDNIEGFVANVGFNLY